MLEQYGCANTGMMQMYGIDIESINIFEWLVYDYHHNKLVRMEEIPARKHVMLFNGRDYTCIAYDPYGENEVYEYSNCTLQYVEYDSETCSEVFYIQSSEDESKNGTYVLLTEHTAFPAGEFSPQFCTYEELSDEVRKADFFLVEPPCLVCGGEGFYLNQPCTECEQ